jgi:hypothetical protein
MKNKRSTRLSPRVNILILPAEKKVSNARNNKAKEAIRENGTSLYIVELFA